MIVSCSLAQMWEEKVQKMTSLNFFSEMHLLRNFQKLNAKGKSPHISSVCFPL